MHHGYVCMYVGVWHFAAGILFIILTSIDGLVVVVVVDGHGNAVLLARSPCFAFSGIGWDGFDNLYTYIHTYTAVQG